MFRMFKIEATIEWLQGSQPRQEWQGPVLFKVPNFKFQVPNFGAYHFRLKRSVARSPQTLATDEGLVFRDVV